MDQVRQPARPLRMEELEAQRGFTLIELMVVVAIIALLAAIIIPNYVHSRATAAVAQSEANLKQIATALEIYRGDNDTYPTTNGNVTPALFTPPAGNGTSGINPYLTTTPYNALGHAMYTYTYVAGTGGGGGAAGNASTSTYVIDDPGVYDPTTMNNVPAKPGTGSAGALCANNCTTLHYTPQDGIYGGP